jgi:hypothetical protein
MTMQRALICLALVSACGEERRARRAMDAYFVAVGKGDGDAAWKLACREDRDARSRDEVRELLGSAAKTDPKARYRIDSVTRTNGTATAVVHRTGGDGSGTAIENYVLRREAETWCVDTDWAEDKRLMERAARISRLKREAEELLDADRPAEALAKYEEAYRLKPESEDLERLVELARKGAAEMIAGHWRLTTEKDPTKDDANVHLELRAHSKPSGAAGGGWPYLRARCVGRKLALFVNVETVVEASSRHVARGRVRIDAADPEKVRFGLSGSYDTLFFREPETWIKRLAALPNSKLTMEVPLHEKGRRAIVFDLTGADVALPKVLAPCQK